MLGTDEKLRMLVKALLPNEKGYLRKFAKAELEQARHVALEKMMDKISGDSKEERLCEEWMFDFLMFGLEEYHKTPASEMRGILNQVDVLLVDKDLPDQAEKLILRGKKLAEKEGLTDMLMEISELETALLAIKPPSDELIKSMEKTFEDIQELSDEHDSFIFKKIKEVEK